MQLRARDEAGDATRRSCSLRMRRRRWTVLVVLAATLPACSGGADDVPEAFVRLAIEESDPERLLRHYFGGYVSPVPADPFDAGILHERSGRMYVDAGSLRRHQPWAAKHLVDSDGDGRIGWDEFESFVERTYDVVRSAPASLEDLAREASFDTANVSWMRVEVHGVMTTARRRIYVRESAVRDAVAGYTDRNRRLIYPVGTIFIGEHYVDGRRVETTAMRKREDGFWDYFVYDANGMPAGGTSTPPRDLDAPIQCVGCHIGDRLFEPERSFPAGARPGPHGPRRVYVDDDLRDEAVVRYFDEHRRRSDTVLGLYGTLFVSKLRAERRAGRLGAADEALLASLPL